jgi:hypothetical protein
VASKQVKKVASKQVKKVASKQVKKVASKNGKSRYFNWNLFLLEIILTPLFLKVAIIYNLFYYK